MIKVDGGNIVIDGIEPVINAEFTSLVMAMFEKSKEKTSEDEAEKMVVKLVKNGIRYQKLKEKDQLDNYLEEEIHKIIAKMFALMESEDDK